MSLVFHSAHPHIPTLRADVRLFEVSGWAGNPAPGCRLLLWGRAPASFSGFTAPTLPFCPCRAAAAQVEGQAWYGGGCDLTPFYVHESDFAEFHGFWRATCDRHDPTVRRASSTALVWAQLTAARAARRALPCVGRDPVRLPPCPPRPAPCQLYPAFKAWCDRYFYIPARKEHRGVGGLFFDDLDAAAASYDVAQASRAARGAQGRLHPARAAWAVALLSLPAPRCMLCRPSP